MEPPVPGPPPDSSHVGQSRGTPSGPVHQPPRERVETTRHRVTPRDFKSLLPGAGSEPGMSGKHDRTKKFVSIVYPCPSNSSWWLKTYFCGFICVWMSLLWYNLCVFQLGEDEMFQSCSRKWPTTQCAAEINALEFVLKWAYERYNRKHPSTPAEMWLGHISKFQNECLPNNGQMFHAWITCIHFNSLYQCGACLSQAVQWRDYELFAQLSVSISAIRTITGRHLNSESDMDKVWNYTYHWMFEFNSQTMGYKQVFLLEFRCTLICINRLKPNWFELKKYPPLRFVSDSRPEAEGRISGDQACDEHGVWFKIALWIFSL